jgi:ferrous iron transport protein B
VESDEHQQTLREKLQADYTPLTAFCIMLFCLISTPCIATIVTTGRETNSWRWAIFQLFGLTVLAYVVTLTVYQLGCLMVSWR